MKTLKFIFTALVCTISISLLAMEKWSNHSLDKFKTPTFYYQKTDETATPALPKQIKASTIYVNTTSDAFLDETNSSILLALNGLRYFDKYGEAIQGEVKTKQPYLYDAVYNWTTYMPDLAQSLAKLTSANSENKPNLHTCPNYTQVTVESNLNLTVGNSFSATIRAFNCRGKPKTFGGDYFRARIIKTEDVGFIRPNGIACNIIDNNDGSYAIRSSLPIPGAMVLEVVLVSSVEQIGKLVNVTGQRRFSGTSYSAELSSGEQVECNVDLTVFGMYNSSTLCDYSNPRNKEPWFCSKPNSGNCSTLTWVTFLITTDEPIQHKAFIGYIMAHGLDQNVSSHHLTVSGKYVKDQLPHCSIKLSSKSGFASSWLFFKSLFCGYELNRDGIFPCFQNKIVYFLGDSTVRQYFEFVTDLKKLELFGPDSKKVWQQPKVAFDDEYNVTFYYRAHGPPLQNPGPPSSRPYISDVLDELSGGPNVYVLITISIHLYYYEPSVFIHRVIGIRDALKRLATRHPGTKVIIKGNNVLASPQEWLGLRYDTIMSKLFKNIDSVIFLRLWDITSVWPLNDYHPAGPTLAEEILYTFKFFCDNQ
uniref:LOW QUALITY PROTEIN: NXPE family member 3-like n=1 Tax=Ciona intestinalis TaxID=7719 RepID=UPI000EF4C53E|nr:LOW QUALITY PROTEIN: NXPE family member 3-like [Ciona intestinalis]|eukprot:XP_026692362.1 LOW QUALITY PROTEIN: NXPE family member 3-like [Ciona intestinalis]